MKTEPMHGAGGTITVAGLIGVLREFDSRALVLLDVGTGGPLVPIVSVLARRTVWPFEDRPAQADTPMAVLRGRTLNGQSL